MIFLDWLAALVLSFVLLVVVVPPTNVSVTAAAATTTTTTTKPYPPGAIQSGPDIAGSSFAASVTYDSDSHTVLIVGSTYGRFFEKGGAAISTIPRATSSCFLSTVQLPTDSTNPQMVWRTVQTVGSSEDVASEACAASLYQERNNKLIVVGQSERGGFAEDLYNNALWTEAIQYGLLLEFNVPTKTTTTTTTSDTTKTNPDESFLLVGGRALQLSKISYPLQLASSNQDEYIYVALQETDNVQRNDLSGETTTTTTTSHTGEDIDTTGTTTTTKSSSYIDEVDPMRYFRFGTNFRLSIGQYHMYSREAPTEGAKLQESFNQGWKILIATDDNSAVHVAGMAEMGSILVVVGSTDGKGESFGGSGTSTAKGLSGGMDGFIAKYNVANGSLVSNSTGTQKSSDRIESIDGRDDYIAGMCYDPNNLNFIYIVGSTAGEMDKAAGAATLAGTVQTFAMKINLDTLEIFWTSMLGAVPADPNNKDAPAQVRGISCAVSPLGEAIWIGGVVLDDAILPDSGTTTSFGGHDIFVAKLYTEDGAKQFVRQIGSEDNDGMAMRGGLVLDRQGNAVIVGNTYGSFYRQRLDTELQDNDWISDIFVTTISNDNGAIAYPLGHPEFKGSVDTIHSPTTAQNTDNSRMGVQPHVVAILALFGVCCLAAYMYISYKTEASRNIHTDRSQIIQYLNEFDVDDVDLKHSATGGYHCSYSNDLASGRNRRAERRSPYGLESAQMIASSSSSSSRVLTVGSDPLLSAPLTNSNGLHDSLLMDETNASLINTHQDGNDLFDDNASSKRREGYDGLIDSYNSSQSPNRKTKTDLLWDNEIL